MDSAHLDDPFTPSSLMHVIRFVQGANLPLVSFYLGRSTDGHLGIILVDNHLDIIVLFHQGHVLLLPSEFLPLQAQNVFIRALLSCLALTESFSWRGLRRLLRL